MRHKHTYIQEREREGARAPRERGERPHSPLSREALSCARFLVLGARLSLLRLRGAPQVGPRALYHFVLINYRITMWARFCEMDRTLGAITETVKQPRTTPSARRSDGAVRGRGASVHVRAEASEPATLVDPCGGVAESLRGGPPPSAPRRLSTGMLTRAHGD